MAEFQSTNITDCVRYIYRNLGAKLIIPELSTSEIVRIIQQESLKTFSKYFPYVLRMNMTNEMQIPGKPGFYKIPNMEMLEMIRMRMMWGNNAYSFTNGLASIPLSLNPIASQLYSDYLSAVTTPLTWTYHAPDILERYPKQGTNYNLVIEVETVHPDHLKTIGIKMRDHFYRLALLDVLISLYPLRRRFETLSSEYGAISLVIDKIESASNERDNLLQVFEQRSIFTGNRKRAFFA